MSHLPPESQPGAPSRAGRLAAGASVVVVLALVALTLMSYRAARRQRATADALARGIAGWAGQRFATTVTNDLYVTANAVFSRVGLSRGGSEGARPSLGAILDAADRIAQCRCAPALRTHYSFRVDFDRSTVDVQGRHGPVAGAAPLALLARNLAALRPIEGWDFALLSALDPGGRFLFVARHPAGGPVFYGFAADSGDVIRLILDPCLKRRTALVADLPGTTLSPASVYLRILLPGGLQLGNSHPGFAPRDTVTNDLPFVMGALRVEASLLEPDRSVLAGAALASPVPLALLLAVLGALALAMLWWSARRATMLASARATFTSSLSHELRTPLTQILLYAELVRRGSYPENGGRGAAADVIIRESRRLLRLIGNALELASNGGNGSRVRAAPVALGPAVASALEDYRLLAAERGTELRLAVRGEPTVLGDADAVRQIVVNLVDNAVRHGLESGTVTAGAEVHGDAVELFVEDGGPGIPAAERGRVWEPFVRLQGLSRTGSGIGLAVVRSLAQRYGGQVGIRDAVPSGTRVFVRFPAATGSGAARP